MKSSILSIRTSVLVLSFFFLFLADKTIAQKGEKAFGIQFKPFLPLDVVNVGSQSFLDSEKNTRLTIDQGFGFAFGASVRFGLSKRFSLETGINYIRRDYSFVLSGTGFKTSTAELQFTNYEIPLLGMIFVQLGRDVYMNAAGGLAFDLYPTGGIITYDRDTIEYGMLEQQWLNVSLLANLGFEYRTKEMGYIYLGASYHRPFSSMAEVYVSYRKPNTRDFESLLDPPPSVSGSYFSIDIRYFFNPGKNKKSRGKD